MILRFSLLTLFISALSTTPALAGKGKGKNPKPDNQKANVELTPLSKARTPKGKTGGQEEEKQAPPPSSKNQSSKKNKNSKDFGDKSEEEIPAPNKTENTSPLNIDPKFLTKHQLKELEKAARKKALQEAQELNDKKAEEEKKEEDSPSSKNQSSKEKGNLKDIEKESVGRFFLPHSAQKPEDTSSSATEYKSLTKGQKKNLREKRKREAQKLAKEKAEEEVKLKAQEEEARKLAEKKAQEEADAKSMDKAIQKVIAHNQGQDVVSSPNKVHSHWGSSNASPGRAEDFSDEEGPGDNQKDLNKVAEGMHNLSLDEKIPLSMKKIPAENPEADEAFFVDGRQSQRYHNKKASEQLKKVLEQEKKKEAEKIEKERALKEGNQEAQEDQEIKKIEEAVNRLAIRKETPSSPHPSEKKLFPPLQASLFGNNFKKIPSSTQGGGSAPSSRDLAQAQTPLIFSGPLIGSSQSYTLGTNPFLNPGAIQKPLEGHNVFAGKNEAVESSPKKLLHIVGPGFAQCSPQKNLKQSRPENLDKGNQNLLTSQPFSELSVHTKESRDALKAFTPSSDQTSEMLSPKLPSSKPMSPATNPQQGTRQIQEETQTEPGLNLPPTNPAETPTSNFISLGGAHTSFVNQIKEVTQGPQTEIPRSSFPEEHKEGDIPTKPTSSISSFLTSVTVPPLTLFQWKDLSGKVFREKYKETIEKCEPLLRKAHEIYDLEDLGFLKNLTRAKQNRSYYEMCLQLKAIASEPFQAQLNADLREKLLAYQGLIAPKTPKIPTEHVFLFCSAELVQQGHKVISALFGEEWASSDQWKASTTSGDLKKEIYKLHEMVEKEAAFSGYRLYGEMGDLPGKDKLDKIGKLLVPYFRIEVRVGERIIELDEARQNFSVAKAALTDSNPDQGHEGSKKNIEEVYFNYQDAYKKYKTVLHNLVNVCANHRDDKGAQNYLNASAEHQRSLFRLKGEAMQDLETYRAALRAKWDNKSPSEKFGLDYSAGEDVGRWDKDVDTQRKKNNERFETMWSQKIYRKDEN